MVDFTRIIEVSFEWTRAVCFRPFHLKKWLMLTFIAWIAGFLAGGFNFNPPWPDKKTEHKQSEVSKPSQNSQPVLRESDSATAIKSKQTNRRLIFGIIFLAILLFLMIIILMTWLFSRFSFIFLGAVAKNDASVKIPFREYKTLGNSLCGFYLAFTAGFSLALGGLVYPLIRSLIKIGVFDKPMPAGFKQVFLTVLPYGILIILLFLIAGLISFITGHFVLPVMLKEKSKITQAWPKTFSLLMSNKSSFILYILVILALCICAGMVYSLVYLMVFLGLIFPGGVVAGICYLIYLAIPPSLHVLYFVLLGMILVPLLSCISYCLAAIYLPIAVFKRTFSMKFITALNGDYDLFKFNPGEVL